MGGFPSNLGIFCFLEDDWASVDYFDFLVSGDFCIQGGTQMCIRDRRKPSKQEVAAHIVNLVWYGLSGMRKDPHLVTDSAKKLAS